MIPVLALMILGFALFIAGSLIAYVIVYNCIIKKRIQRGETGGRQWPSPKNVLLVVLSIAVVIALTITVINVVSAWLYTNNTDSGVSEANTQSLDVVSYTSEELKDSNMAVYASAFETGELKGYTKEESTEGDFHYVLFKSEDTYDVLHPAFVMFVEYTGDEEYGYFADEIGLYGYEVAGTSVATSTCGDASEYYFVAGNYDWYDVFCNYSLGLYKSDKNMKFDIENGGVPSADTYIDIDITME